MLRATLSLRCYAALRTVLTHALRMPHAIESLKNPFLCNLCKVLACKYLYFKLKQGKDITAQVNCVRGMEHAVRQYEALAKYRSEA
ncbi:MAG: hypothetical protein NZ519_02035 [Bacteroidia bacterium]|nr:hypothetical protein [Bacteroidia bacterium]